MVLILSFESPNIARNCCSKICQSNMWTVEFSPSHCMGRQCGSSARLFLNGVAHSVAKLLIQLMVNKIFTGLLLKCCECWQKYTLRDHRKSCDFLHSPLKVAGVGTFTAAAGALALAGTAGTAGSMGAAGTAGAACSCCNAIISAFCARISCCQVISASWHLCMRMLVV